ncbi:MAG: type VI secretion protein, partial [Streptococcaceae bacterium]|nr:type VI secretion protein [Streptococcaceae bacterium]
YWAKTGGTYKDIDKTSMIEQKTGLRDIRKSDWVGERGTVRDVEKYDIDPKRLRALRKGEFYLYRKALENPMKPKVFYARKVV